MSRLTLARLWGMIRPDTIFLVGEVLALGGQAKFRRDEIVELKRRSPEDAARWRQMQEDKRRVASGIDPESSDPTLPVAMARAMGALFIEAKRSGNVDPAVTFLYETINATVRGVADVPVACKKGCSHCCHTWVSVAAPEAIFIAKILKQRGNGIVEKVRLAHEHTKDYDFDTRDQHPQPCPLLDNDTCSIYDDRPEVCRASPHQRTQRSARARTTTSPTRMSQRP